MSILYPIIEFYDLKIDITEDKRYTLSKKTKEILKNLDQEVYCQIYLEGEKNLPKNFKILRDEAKKLLFEFSKISSNKFKFVFIDLYGNNENKKYISQLEKVGVPSLDVIIKKEIGVVHSKIFTGGFLRVGKKQTIINLFERDINENEQKSLSNSIANLEYKIISSLLPIINTKKSDIGIVINKGNVKKENLLDFNHSLSQRYNIHNINLRSIIEDSIKVLHIINPTKNFTEKEKFIIDQYVMNGGKVVWSVSISNASMDSISRYGFTKAELNNINLDDMFYNYGVRLESSLIADAVNSLSIPIMSPSRKTVMIPWVFSFIGLPNENNIITKNKKPYKFSFSSNIFYVKNNLKKITLSNTSSKTKEYSINIPKTISLEYIKNIKKYEDFNFGKKKLISLIEGEFISLFKGRTNSYFIDLKKTRDKSKQNKMIFIADGNFFTNKFDKKNNRFFPMGYDFYSKKTFGNKIFLERLMYYLTDNKDLLHISKKEILIKRLDKYKVKLERKKWIVINSVIPILFILIFGFIKLFIRKRKHTTI